MFYLALVEKEHQSLFSEGIVSENNTATLLQLMVPVNLNILRTRMGHVGRVDCVFGSLGLKEFGHSKKVIEYSRHFKVARQIGCGSF